jgi:hypothetical protein
MKNMQFLFEPLNTLIVKYRSIPFEEWNARTQFHDDSDVEETSEHWWQAHTGVLEIDRDEDGRRYALVSVTIYPSGVHSSPPAPSAALKIYEDGTVMGTRADSTDFTWRQHAG